MPFISVATSRPFLNHCLEVARLVQLGVQPALLERRRVRRELVVLAAGLHRVEGGLGASMPVLMAAWLPLMRLTFR
jgi:hypothetical protein